MAVPAVICYHLCAPFMQRQSPLPLAAAFVCGAGSVFLGAILVGASLMFTEDSFLEVAGLVVTAHLPIMIIEGIITVFCVSFLKKVKPEMLPGHNR